MIILAMILLLMMIFLLVSIGISIHVGLKMTRKVRIPLYYTPQQYGMKYFDFRTTSRDRKTSIAGWVMEPQQAVKMTVILSHGYAGNRLEENVGFMSLSKGLLARGFRVVVFDFRACGSSGGSATSIGGAETLDLLGVIDWVKRKTKEPIALYGISMGATVSLLAAAEEKDVQAVIADSPFSDLKTYLQENLSVWTNLPKFPFTSLMMTIIPKMTDVDTERTSPIRVAGKIHPTPVLLIHGKEDPLIPATESEKLANHHSDTFQIWITESSRHVKSFIEQPVAYLDRMTSFLNRSIQRED